MKISVIGCGYLGAVHAAAMASLGHDVVGVDVDAARVEQLSLGEAPFYEPGLGELLTSGLASGRLRFTTDIDEVAAASVHFVAVGTPQSFEGQSADLTYVNAAIEELIPRLAPGSLVVGKSTVPVGTAEQLAFLIDQHAPQASLAWNPEFLREGFAVRDTLRPDRIVYGVPGDKDAERVEKLLDQVYAQALTQGTPKVVTNYATAELVKVAANAFLATKISFINAMAEISEVVGADVTQLADAIGHDNRIGRRFLNAGVGFGGGCLPKDIRAFAARAEELGLGESVAFLHEVDAINMRRRSHVIELAESVFGGDVSGKRITILGVSFKPDSDDIRDSPALDVAVGLYERGAAVVVTDPQGIENARQRHPELHYAPDPSDALAGAELVILLTEWTEYKSLDPHLTRLLVSDQAGPATIIDARNVLDPASWRAADWRYLGLGR
ncbi:UDP-glucose dehydrogenase family protein [Leucobacter sp. Z1108]|uniref:UDP-glucose dehydrogenase family protein n=1 Tax=Leucobacter sp. Z1108 TaxID=3439066 RepID=UPI003F3E94B5